MVAWLCEYAGAAAVIFGFNQFFTYLFASCLLFIAMADDITQDLIDFNIYVTVTAETPNAADHAELKHPFCFIIIQIYTDAK